jgi:iron complex outermembrane recepter protein
MKSRAFLRLSGACSALLLAPATAFAQDAENAVESAEDAFGTSTRHDQIGVYDEGNVRGFSPGSAGNFRMEGMYFDIQGGLSGRVLDGETIRVGTAAQGYAFPAPTGVVDLTLRKAGDQASATPFLSFDSFGSRGAELDLQLPLAGKELALSAGAGLYDNHFANGGGSTGMNVGGVLRWRPAPRVELLAFANHQEFNDETSQLIYIANGNFLLPRPKRGVSGGPRWALSDSESNSFGLVGHASLGEWTLRTGLFRSSFKNDGSYTNLAFVNPDASTDRQIYAAPASNSASWSGEARLSRRFIDGPRQHLITLTLRGRSINSAYGGGDLVDLGPAGLNEEIFATPPQFNFTPLTGDYTRQLSEGASYSFKWKGIGEFTAGLLRTHYSKRVEVPLSLAARGSTDATLPYFSAALSLAPNLTLYGSFVRGLEDSGSAPGYASNANEVLPATRTRQIDFGLRWSPIKDTTLIVGFFTISKPYIDIDSANHFGELGRVTNRGIEFSLTTNPTKNVRIVAGGVWLDPRLEASPLIAQPVGLRPVGQPQLRTRFNINWTPPFAPKLTLDAYVNHDSGSWATLENSVYSPGSTRIGFGARYRFKLAGRDFTARVGVYNVFDTYMLFPFGSGVYGYNTQRNVQGWLTTEF